MNKKPMTEKPTIKIIKVISNTHWDREFRKSFERTRVGLLKMMDTLLDILEKDPEYHSFTLDGHTILLEDYLEIRPEKQSLVEKYLQEGRLVAGPWYTLAEQFSISHEAIVRNLLFGREAIKKYEGKTGTVAYTPASWGQTGQLPQILSDFGLDKMMFYRGISHHESDAEFIWESPDGTRVLASRFGLYARYNWYYQVHRPLTRKGKVFDKEYMWGENDEIPVRSSDSVFDQDPSFELLDPSKEYDPAFLKDSVIKMIEAEGNHFTTPVFPAMNGHDISVAHPMESKIVKEAATLLSDKYKIEQGSLEEFWNELNKYLDRDKLAVLEGERRSYLKTGMWTYLFPGTISARTYLKIQDFESSMTLSYSAEPLASLAFFLGNEYPYNYLKRGWKYLLSNHTHDANGGCAPDAVCLDMEYRYRKVRDISEIVINDALHYIAKNLSPGNINREGLQYIVFNPLPFTRDAIVKIDLELPSIMNAKSVDLYHENSEAVSQQSIHNEKSSVFVDSIWDVPTILNTNRLKFYAQLKELPPLGYRAFKIIPLEHEMRNQSSMLTGPDTMENFFLKVRVNSNGTINITHKLTGKTFHQLNYITDQGEAGNAWQHEPVRCDRKISSLGASAQLSVKESGPLVCTVSVGFNMKLPVDYADGTRRNDITVEVPVNIDYTLEKDVPFLKVRLRVDNKARDHWFRVNFPSGIETDKSIADSHFDIVERPIKIPESTGWVEEARGTHPLRTFVDVHDGNTGLACFTKGIFEYEVFDDPERTVSLTLIRACRIKLKVSEEKITELPDEGIQCPGIQVFEYAVFPHSGDHLQANLINLASQYYTMVRSVMSGRGKGNLPGESFLFTVNNPLVHVTAVKLAEEKDAIILRMVNTSNEKQDLDIEFSFPVKIWLVKMDESILTELPVRDKHLKYSIGKKKILTLKIKH